MALRGGERARHRRRGLHRLEPRPRPARARRRGAGARQLLDRLPREPRRARRRAGRGRAAQLRARAQRRPRRRGRLPPRRARLGSALGAGPADLERGQRRGHAQRAARRPGRGRSAGSSSPPAPPCTGRSRSCRSHEAVPPDPISPYGVAKLAAERYCISFSRVYDALRERRRPLLQRLRPAPEPVLAVRGGDPALHHRDRRGPARSRSRATASSAATSRTSTTSSTGRCAPRDAEGASGPDLQRRRRARRRA